MRQSFSVAALAVCALVATVACSSDPAPSPGPAARQIGTRSVPAPAATGGYAFASTDASYQSVLAEARRTGKPALLFFWTSW